MATIPHTHTEQNTEQTNSTTTFTAVSGMAQTSGNFVTGKKYLIIASAQYGFTAVQTSLADVQLVHGATVFEGSLVSSATADANPKETYVFMTVWTAVSSEGIDMQFRRNPTSTGTATVNFASLLSIQLDDYLTDGTHYTFAERTTDDTLTGSYTAGASVTFTPATASHNWLILPVGNFDYNANTGTITTRLNQDSGAAVLPQMVAIPQNNTNIHNYATPKVMSLPAASVTFTEEASSTGTTNVRRYSAILALDLDAFSAYGFTYTEADTNFASTSGYSDQMQTASVTPTATSDVWVFASWGFDRAQAARIPSFRVQVDNSDQPAGQTTAAYTFYNEGGLDTTETVLTLSTMANLSNAAHTVDLDGHVSSLTSTPSYQQRTVVAIQLSTPDGGDPPPSAVTWVGYIG